MHSVNLKRIFLIKQPALFKKLASVSIPSTKHVLQAKMFIWDSHRIKGLLSPALFSSIVHVRESVRIYGDRTGSHGKAD